MTSVVTEVKFWSRAKVEDVQALAATLENVGEGIEPIIAVPDIIDVDSKSYQVEYVQALSSLGLKTKLDSSTSYAVEGQLSGPGPGSVILPFVLFITPLAPFLNSFLSKAGEDAYEGLKNLVAKA